MAEPTARDVLAALLMQARHPATPNAPHWVSIIVPEDFIEVAERALSKDWHDPPDPAQ